MPAQDFIIQTKINLPKLKGKILLRPKTLDVLDDNLDKKLTIICADAGYGKTTLLIQFCQELEKPFTYYSIGPSDNDLVIFFSYIVAGIKKKLPRFGEGVKKILPRTRDTDILVGTIINEFVENCKTDLYLILDDYHFIQHNWEITRAIEYLLEHAPANLHLIIASRVMPPINLTHYRSKQDLLHLEKKDLKFTAKEIATLLKEVYDLKIPDEEISRIEYHSEGWITAIQLILQKIHITGDVKAKETLNGYIASGEDIYSYFASEVFEHQTTEIQKFLMHTSILDYLSPEACNHLLNTIDTSKLLANLEMKNLFVSKIGNQYKYHHLFQDFLFSRLKNQYPGDKIKELHNRVGHFYLTNQDYQSACHHFLHAENYGLTVKILDKKYEYWLNTGKLTNFINLVDRFPVTVIELYPALQLKKTKFLAYLTKIEPAVKTLKSIITRRSGPKDRRLRTEALHQMARLDLIRQDVSKVKHFLDQAWRLVSKRDKRQVIDLMISYGDYYRSLGILSKSEAYLNEARKALKKTKDPGLDIKTLKSLISLCWAKFEFKKAAQLFDEMFSRHDPDQMIFEFGSSFSNAAAVAIQNLDFDKALLNLDRAEKFAKKFNIITLHRSQLFTRADLYFFKGEYPRALEYYQKGLEVNRKIKNLLIEHTGTISTCWTYLRMGKLDRCTALLKNMESAILKTANQIVIIQYHLLKGKIETLRHDFNAAAKHFNVGLQESRKNNLNYLEMFIYYEMTRMHIAQHDLAQAEKSLYRALTIAKNNGYDTTLIFEGRHDLSVIEFGLENNIVGDYLQNILNRVNTTEAKYLINKINISQGMYDVACYLLGEFAIKDRQGSLLDPPWRSQKAKSILAYLIINRTNGSSKDALIDNFWPDKKLDEAAHSLQVEISWLRNFLKDISQTEIPAKSLIIYKNQRYHLDTNLMVKIDIEEFETLINEAETKEPTNIPSSLNLYEKALKLYRGDFCSDIAEEWTDNFRLHYKELLLKVLIRSGEICLAHRDYKKSLEFYQKALKYDGYNEKIHAAIMRCYLKLNDRKSVQEQYEELLKNLNSIGISNPSPEVTEIYKVSMK